MQTSDDIKLEGPQPTWRDVLRNLIFIGIAVGVAYWVTVRIGIDDLRASVSSWGLFAPLIIVLLKALTIIVVPLGGAPIYAVAGALWGFWQGLFITLIGDLIGATAAFYISRAFGASILRFFMGRQELPMVREIMERAGEPRLFWKARISFAGFPELFAYAAGLTKVGYPLFIIAFLSVHAISASLLVIFGQVLVGGSWLAVIAAGLISTLIAAAGIFWFHADLKKGN